MTTTLERRYRRLLWAYPRPYRMLRGDELLGTLLDLSDEGQRWPTLRQSTALLLTGLRVRAGIDRMRSAGHVWRDSARAALVLMLTWQVLQTVLAVLTHDDLAETGEPPSWRFLGGSATTVLLAGVAIGLLLTGRRRAGVGFALITPLAALVPPFNNTWDTLFLYAAACWCLPVACLAVPVLRRPPEHGPWRWLLAAPLFVLASATLTIVAPSPAALAGTLAAVVAFLAWTALIDPRPAIALGLVLLTVIPQVIASVSVLILLVPVLLAMSAILLTIGTVRAHRHAPA